MEKEESHEWDDHAWFGLGATLGLEPEKQALKGQGRNANRSMRRLPARGGLARHERASLALLYSAASSRLLLRFSFILRRPTTIAFKTAGLTPLVMSARTSAR